MGLEITWSRASVNLKFETGFDAFIVPSTFEVRTRLVLLWDLVVKNIWNKFWKLRQPCELFCGQESGRLPSRNVTVNHSSLCLPLSLSYRPMSE